MYEHTQAQVDLPIHCSDYKRILDPSSSPLSSPPSIRSSQTLENSEGDEREMYKAYNWTCKRCHLTQEIIHRCTVAEHLMECDGQKMPVLRCGKCKTQIQTCIPSIDPALLAISDGSVNSPQLNLSSGSGPSSPLAERSGRYRRKRLATPCKREPARHHPYRHPTSAPGGHRKSQGKSVAPPGECLLQSAPLLPRHNSSFTTEISNNSLPSSPQPSTPPPPLQFPYAYVDAYAHHPHSPQPDVVEKMHVNRTKLFKTAATDLSEAKSKLGDQAPQRVCNAWEVAWDQLKKDMGIIF